MTRKRGSSEAFTRSATYQELSRIWGVSYFAVTARVFNWKQMGLVKTIRRGPNAYVVDDKKGGLAEMLAHFHSLRREPDEHTAAEYAKWWHVRLSVANTLLRHMVESGVAVRRNPIGRGKGSVAYYTIKE